MRCRPSCSTNRLRIEGVNRTLVQQMQAKAMLASNIALLPGGDGWLFVEFGAHSPESSREQAHGFAASLPEGHSAAGD